MLICDDEPDIRLPFRRSCPHAHVLVLGAHGAIDIFRRSRARGATACFEKTDFAARIPRLAERYGAA